MSDEPDEYEKRRSPKGAAFTELVLAIFRANGRILRAGERMGRDLDLTSPRWQVLGAIAARPKTVAQIGRDFELTRQGILWLVKSMLKEGLVELIDNPDHRRAKLVRMTPKGRSRWQSISERQLVWSEDLAKSFDRAELKAGLRAVERMSALLEPAADEQD